MRLRPLVALFALAACHRSLEAAPTIGSADDAGAADAGAADTAPDVPVVPVFDPAPLAAAICAAVRACDGCAWPDCEASVASSIPTSPSSKQTFDAAALDGCIGAYRKLVEGGCTPIPELPYAGTPLVVPGICGHVFEGTVPPGGACETNSDCKAGPGEQASCQTTCGVARTSAGEGATCGEIEPGINELCKTSDGLLCNHTSFGAVCQYPKKGNGVGQPCGDGCDSQTICDDAGTCIARQPVGASCVIVQHIQGPTDNCVPDAYCTSGTCAARGKVGDGCGFDTCTRGLSCINGICRQAVPQPCFWFPERCGGLSCPQ